MNVRLRIAELVWNGVPSTVSDSFALRRALETQLATQALGFVTPKAARRAELVADCSLELTNVAATIVSQALPSDKTGPSEVRP